MSKAWSNSALAAVCSLGFGLIGLLWPATAMAECSGEGSSGSVSIPDQGSISRNIIVGETGEVTSIIVSVSLNHPFLADLDISLTSPDGTIVDLSSDNLQSLGINGSITFDDSAAQSVVGAVAPLQSIYRPEQPLATFAGEGLSGTWKLTVADDASDDAGTLEGWSIGYCYIPGIEEGEGSNEGMSEGDGEPEQCSGEGFLGTLNIPDVDAIAQNILVPETGLVSSVSLSISLTHTFFADLDLLLTSPTGTSIELTTDNLGGTDIDGTITFSDAAPLSIVGANAPLQPSYQPEVPLATFVGESLSGNWTLIVGDDGAGDTGTLNGWSISYCYTALLQEGEGAAEGEGSVEGTLDGEGGAEGTTDGEGMTEGMPDGEGGIDGEGTNEGSNEGTSDGEGVAEGEGLNEGEGAQDGEGTTDGEGSPEGSSEGEGEGEGTQDVAHSADRDGDFLIALSELLRLVQLFNLQTFGCSDASEDGFAPNSPDQTCLPHASDYDPQNWSISLTELTRLIQLYNALGFEPCQSGEDGYCPLL